jgi:pantetheine-phosphate adenylyltransferase
VSAKHHKALYPGSFDPPTLGHIDVLSRARGLFDEIVIAVGCNPDKKAFLDVGTRMRLMQDLIDELIATAPDEAPVTLSFYDGLTVDYAREVGASAIIRGIRNVTDLQAECQLAITNRQVADVETVFVVPGEAFAYTSSSLIRQIALMGGELDRLRTMLAPSVIAAIRERRDTVNDD